MVIRKALIKTKLFRNLFLFFATLGLAQNAVPQSNNYVDRIGRPDFAVVLPVEFGFYDAANGGLHLEIPLGTVVERGGKTAQVSLTYDNKLWSWSWQYAPANGWYPVNVHGSQGGWKIILKGATEALISPPSCPPSGNGSIPMCINIGPSYGTSFSTCDSGDPNNPGQITYFTGWAI